MSKDVLHILSVPTWQCAMYLKDLIIIFFVCAFHLIFFFGEGIGKRKNHFRVTWSENLFRTGAQELCIVL